MSQENSCSRDPVWALNFTEKEFCRSVKSWTQWDGKLSVGRMLNRATILHLSKWRRDYYVLQSTCGSWLYDSLMQFFQMSQNRLLYIFKSLWLLCSFCHSLDVLSAMVIFSLSQIHIMIIFYLLIKLRCQIVALKTFLSVEYNQCLLLC